MVLPLFPQTPPSFKDFLWVLLSLLVGAVCEAIVLMGLTFLKDSLEIKTVMIPLAIRLGFSILMTLSLCALCGIANPKLVSVISFTVLAVFSLQCFFLDGWLPNTQRSELNIEQALITSLVPQSIVKTVLVCFGFLVPYWLRQINSGIGIIFSGAISGLVYSGMINMAKYVDELEALDRKIDPELKYTIYMDCFIEMTFYSIVGTLSSMFIAYQHSDLLKPSALWYFSTIMVPFSFVLAYNSANFISARSEALLLYLGPVVVYLAAATSMLVSLWPLRSHIKTNLGQQYTPI